MWEILTFFALFLTLLAILWYAWETREMKRQIIKQTELSLRPFVIISFSESGDKYQLINLGKTPALHVKIDDVSIINEEDLQIKYIFPETDLIPPDAKCDIRDIEKKINDEISDTDTFDLGALIPYSAQRTFNVKVRYKNISNEEYITEGKVGEGTFDFKRIEKIS